MSDTLETPAAPAAGDDLRAVLNAAWDIVESDDTTGTDTSRDERGRFASEKTDDVATDGEPSDKDTDQPEVKADDTAPADIDAPRTWSDDEKAEWASLSPKARETVLRREKEAEQAIAERDRQARETAPMRELLDKYKEKHARLGIPQAEAVRRVLAYADALEVDPDNAFPALMRDFGYDPNRLFNTPTQTSQPDPVVRSVVQLQQELAALKSAEQTRTTQTIAQTIETFAQNPANSYFDEVRYDMGLLMAASEQAGKPMTLEEAYAKAVRANDATWAKVQADNAKLKEAADRKAAAEKAAQARKASGSVRDAAPGRGAPPANRPAPSLREEIDRAWNAASAA